MSRYVMPAVCLLVSLWSPGPSSAADEQGAPPRALVGTWACQSVYGGPLTGRSCRTWPQLVLNEGGTYTWGSEQGVWEVKDGVLSFSGRTGTARRDADGRLIVEYEVKGTRYRQTLFKR